METARSIANLQKQIEHSNELRTLKEDIKGKINERFNLELREIYTLMMENSSKVPPAELNRFLLRIRQKSNGYEVKGGYVSFNIINQRGSPSAEITCNFGGIWNGLISPLKVEGNLPWVKTYKVSTPILQEQRKIVAAFMPHAKETCDFIKDCWEVLISGGKDRHEIYHAIAYAMTDPIKVEG